jgi:hypothetical protein
MAKKQETKKVDVAPKVKATNEMTEVVIESKKTKAPKWENKDRVYYLKGTGNPVARILKSSCLWFDEEKGYEREVMYCENQKTVFVDEMQGLKRPGRVIFRDGALIVPKNKAILQKFLSLYHKDLNLIYYEYKPEVIAVDEVAQLESEVDALIAARNLDIDMAEAVMRAELGSEVSKMSSKELKRDLLLFAKRNPALFLDLINDDNLFLRNMAIKSVENNLINLSADQRTFSWSSTGKTLCSVPFDQHPYSALAAWFKTDEGMDVYSTIEKRLK